MKATIDFETYSEAGYLWDEDAQKWRAPPGATKGGLPAIGIAQYAAHPSTEVLMLWYDLHDGAGRRYWAPGMPPPESLFKHVEAGGVLEAVNSAFELWVWNRVCVTRYGFPPLPVAQTRDCAAKARAWGLPGSLAGMSESLRLKNGKIADGDRLIKKFSCPRKPTKSNPSKRLLMQDDPLDAAKFIVYGERDVVAETEASERIPELSDYEHRVWLLDQQCNLRGVAVDLAAVDGSCAILTDALASADAKMVEITAGYVNKTSEVAKLQEWLRGQGVAMASLDADAIDDALERDDLPDLARRALELRGAASSASVKKVFAIQRQQLDGRLHNLFKYHGARTGRDTGESVQPQNLPKKGPKIRQCADATCGKYYGSELAACPHCGADAAFSEPADWGAGAAHDACQLLASGDLAAVERVYGSGSALSVISGSVRGMFVARPGHDLICSDFSAIEAVVTAALAGEQWRLDAFARGDDIYLRSASSITGTPFEQYDKKHPDRQAIGKPAELGLGFGGWVTAWRQFDKSDRYDDERVKQLILAWREASPAIVELWGGQVRGKPWAPTRHEYYGLEGAAVQAVLNPGQRYHYRLISYQVRDDVLYCRLPSGREIAYHQPRLSPSNRWENQQSLSFTGYNTNPNQGAMGWVQMNTYGGKLCENVVQATARDIMVAAWMRLDAAGYPIVLRVHDELVAEVPHSFGSVQEFEFIMSGRPAWAADWPIKVGGGWRGLRYRKD